jgi:photosystem II stability/assembly factor-like uncharacterized protein
MGRVDDIFMVDPQTGYAVNADGSIAKTTDGGDNWLTINNDTGIYCRSVEFINSQKGFVGGFANFSATSNILRMTVDGGASWTDLTPMIDPRARGGICGLSIADSSTIYGCGNYYQDSAYIVKSNDGGNTWSFIDMRSYTTHLIDMYFLNKDTGFATGTGTLPLQPAVILYTTDGGMNWTHKFQDTVFYGYCWKIQHLSDQIYFASLQGSIPAGGRILKSTDGGMNWTIYLTPITIPQNGIQGVGFIDSLKGWTGGAFGTFETLDGGITWDTIPVCNSMNRVFKVNDTLVFASGSEIWKYNANTVGISHPNSVVVKFASINSYPNPASKYLNIDLKLLKSTRAALVLLDENGKRVNVIDNSYKSNGDYQYKLNTENLTNGMYYIVLKTHEDDIVSKVFISH